MEIKLNKPQAISVFNFNYIDLDKKHTEKQYMRDFELQYIPPTDSSKMYRTFATVSRLILMKIKVSDSLGS